MAVVPISKIQLRRGRKNSGSGLPQLSSGEMGWAVDSQELYIGNGSVAEGAPTVGNTKILTEHDSLFEVAKTYVYKRDDGSVITGPDATNPVQRTLQDRLDDIVSVRAFGVTGNILQDVTVLLQRAIDQCFLNNGQESAKEKRVILYLEPGVYTLQNNIYLPPFTNIVGAGKDKTIINFTGSNKTVFTTVSDESIPNSYIQNGDYNTQPRGIRVEGLTINMSTDNTNALVLQSCRDSLFRDIKIAGQWTTGNSITADSTATNGIGIGLYSFNGGVESVRNKFVNVEIYNMMYGVVSNADTNDNQFSGCHFEEMGYGISLGKDLVVDGDVAAGTAYGPTQYTIENSFFKNISKQGIYIGAGNTNVSKNNRFITCGNDGGSDDMPVTSVIKYDTVGNESVGDYFSRTKILSYTQGTIITGNTTITSGQFTIDVTDTSNIRPGQIIIKESGTGELADAVTGTGIVDQVISPTQFSVTLPHTVSGTFVFRIESPIITQIVYIPEVQGPTNVEWGREHDVTIQDGTNLTLFRLPQTIDQSFDISYTAAALEGYNGIRSGTLNVTISDALDSIVVTDDYTFVGDSPGYDTALKLDAVLVDIDNDTVFDTVLIKTYTTNPLPGNARTNFKFKVRAKQA